MMPSELIIVRNLVKFYLFFNELYVVLSVWLLFNNTSYFERHCYLVHQCDETVTPKMYTFHNTFSFTLRRDSA